jgi:EAL domain-containing protein (putative c-di-GMP-specific phosphodiesterase class I)/GGDEF domain-containing protein
MLLTTAASPEGVLDALDLVVLERVGPWHFEPVARPPGWFEAFCGPDGHVGRDSPFLSNFLVSAEAFWATAQTGRTGSGIWTEVGTDGSGQHFEAFARIAGARRLLIVNRLLGSEYPQRQSVFQHARDALLRAERERARGRGGIADAAALAAADAAPAPARAEPSDRRRFERRLAQALASAQPALCLLRIGVDRFRRLQAELGPPRFEALLAQVGERLAACAGTLCRFDAAEFALLLPLADVPVDAVRLVGTVQDLLRPPFQIGPQRVNVTASLGAALSVGEGIDAQALMQCAEQALQASQQRGGDTCRYGAIGIDAAALQQLRLDEALRHALQQHEFVVHYQPRLNLESGRIVGMEALLRWERPGRGLVPPLEFLPFAERTGLIVPLGEWVLRRACQQLRTWREQGLTALVLSVNLSVHQLEHPGLLERVKAILEETQTAPGSLELELTESAVMRDIEACIPLLQQLRNLGVGISIDDFGTGYSSLAYLKRLPIDVLKIDRSFVNDIARDPTDAAIVAAIVTVAHQLKLTTVAEGVASAEQLAVLGQLGCDEVQGFLFSRAVPAQEFATLVGAARATQTAAAAVAVAVADASASRAAAR